MNGDSLAELREQPYDAEEKLQILLAKYPDVLVGDQINPGSARRWLLVKRAAAVPSEEGGTGRWTIYHLFLDQEGVPTVVEVKRSTDARLGREVVGQMLDYAANAVGYWPTDTIRQQVELRARELGQLGDELIQAAFGEEIELEMFWQAVTTNLQAGRVRMIFVADVIPPELRRVVEFLNEQMNPAEVLAIEIPQYVGQNLQALVPRVVGQTARAVQNKRISNGDRRQWDETTFFEEIIASRAAGEVKVARALYDWAKARSLRLTFNDNPNVGVFWAMLSRHPGMGYGMAVRTDGKIELPFARYSNITVGEFQIAEVRQKFLGRIRSIEGIHLASTLSELRYPKIPMAPLARGDNFSKFFDVLNGMMEQRQLEIDL